MEEGTHGGLTTREQDPAADAKEIMKLVLP
jgi:hypothetical protein